MKSYNFIIKDLRAWCKWKNLRYSFFSFLYLFTKYPEYRKLLDFRLSQARGGSLLRMLTYPTTLHQNLYISEWKGRGKIGGGLLFEHGFSTIVYCYSLGENCCINQQVTIGVGNGGAPCIGNNVRIYSGAKIFGNITIGDDVIIGANTVVNKDIPSHCVVVGIPGKIVKTRKDYNSLWEKVY